MTTLSINQEKIWRKLKTVWEWTSRFYTNGFVKIACYETLVNVTIFVICDDDPSHEIIVNNNEIASSNEEKLLVPF